MNPKGRFTNGDAFNKTIMDADNGEEEKRERFKMDRP